MPSSVFDDILGNDIANEVQLAKRLPTYAFQPGQDSSLDEAVDYAFDTLARLTTFKSQDDVSNLDKDAWDGLSALAWSPHIEDVLGYYICAAGAAILNISVPSVTHAEFANGATTAKEDLLSLLSKLRIVEFPNDALQRALARAIDHLLTRFVELRYSTNRTDTCCVPQLRQDIAERFVPFVNMLDVAVEGVMSRYLGGAADVVEFWQRQAEEKLLQIRPRQVSTILLGRHRCRGEMEDLRWCVSNPRARLHFSNHLQHQLKTEHLLAERSTVDVLELYMQIIAGLKDVDPSGVILTRASPPVMTFLRQRDDAVKIIIASLLEPYEDGKASTEVFCAPIAYAMRHIAGMFYRDYYEGSDITDPNWKPDPIDAGPDHKKSISMDELEHLIHLQTKDVFISQLQQNLAERLLNSENASFKEEMALLNLLKTRFTELQIQQCEIMLADVIQSRRLDTDIAKAISQRTGNVAQPEMHTQVLSQHYWPRLKDDSFALPGKLSSATEAYEEEFKKLKRGRRLNWLPALGRVTIELELGGRTISEEVSTLQAAIIQPFDEEWTENDEGGAQRKPRVPGTCTFVYLKTVLDVDDDLLRQGLAFWVHKRVLREKQPDVFVVVEHPDENFPNPIDPGAAAASPSPAPPPSTAAVDSSLKSDKDLLAENAKVYSSFIVGMLTNQGSMPAMRIHMMLRMVVPGGFPFEEAELVTFLQGLAEEGKVERAGAVWRVKKS